MKKLIIFTILTTFIISCSRPATQPWQPTKYKKHKTK